MPGETIESMIKTFNISKVDFKNGDVIIISVGHNHAVIGLESIFLEKMLHKFIKSLKVHVKVIFLGLYAKGAPAKDIPEKNQCLERICDRSEYIFIPIKTFFSLIMMRISRIISI